MTLLLAALCGFALDLLLGDPAWMPHPVILLGKAITGLEGLLRRTFPKGKRGELAAGAVLAMVLPAVTIALSALALWAAGLVHPGLGFALAILWSWQVLALRGLGTESRRVQAALETGTLAQARQAVGRIVGRDTERLDEAGVTRAAVETVAENFSDGVVAPLFCLLLGGPALALGYKAVNTMDSMVGYRNSRYLYFGCWAAKLDDVCNWFPARLSALLLVLAAFLTGEDGRNAFRIWRRDGRNHASPNAGQTEAAMAGALGIQLAGPAWYFGRRYEKPTIGDDTRPIVSGDIRRANKLLYTGGLLALLLLGGLRWLVCFFGGIG